MKTYIDEIQINGVQRRQEDQESVDDNTDLCYFVTTAAFAIVISRWPTKA